MPTPSQFKPSPQTSRGGIGCGIAAAIIAVLLTMALGCGGICAGVFLYFSHASVRTTLEQAGIPVPEISLPEPQTDWEDWMVKRELTHFYQTALESVTTDEGLIKKLGEPIETDIGAEKLFSRNDTGPL